MIGVGVVDTRHAHAPDGPDHTVQVVHTQGDGWEVRHYLSGTCQVTTCPNHECAVATLDAMCARIEAA